MQISNNISNMSFQAIYTRGGAFDRAFQLKSYVGTRDRYERAMDNLLNAAGVKDLLLENYDEGVSVQEFDPETQQTIRFITKDSDFIDGLQKAANILNREQEPEKPVRKRFPGNLDIQG